MKKLFVAVALVAFVTSISVNTYAVSSSKSSSALQEKKDEKKCDKKCAKDSAKPCCKKDTTVKK
jgi:hypothetical protein